MKRLWLIFRRWRLPRARARLRGVRAPVVEWRADFRPGVPIVRPGSARRLQQTPADPSLDFRPIADAKAGTRNLAFVDAEARPRTLAGLQGAAFRAPQYLGHLVHPRAGEEMPTLDRLQAKAWAGRDFKVVALSIDRKGLDAVKPFYAELGLASLGIYCRSIRRCRARRRSAPSAFRPRLLIDREGRELGRKLGPAQWDEAESVALISRAIWACPINAREGQSMNERLASLAAHKRSAPCKSLISQIRPIRRRPKPAQAVRDFLQRWLHRPAAAWSSAAIAIVGRRNWRAGLELAHGHRRRADHPLAGALRRHVRARHMRDDEGQFRPEHRRARPAESEDALLYGGLLGCAFGGRRFWLGLRYRAKLPLKCLFQRIRSGSSRIIHDYLLAHPGGHC